MNSISTAQTDAIDLSGVTGLTEIHVNTFVADPQVWLETAPAVTVTVTVEKTRENKSECDNFLEPMGCAAWRESIRWIRRRRSRSGLALGRWVSDHHMNPEVVIGMDTRESGPWIAEHVAGGLAREGREGAIRRTDHDAGYRARRRAPGHSRRA